MGLNILMAICLYPVCFVIYFVLKAEGKPKCGRYFGVTLKDEWVQEEETKNKIELEEKMFGRNINKCLIISLLIPIICFFIPYISIQLTIWIVWVFAIIVIFYVPFVMANKHLKEWKESKGWNTQINIEKYVELKSLGQVRCVKVSEYILPILITSVTVISGICYQNAGHAQNANPANETTFFILWGTFLFTIVMFAVCSIWLDKAKVQVISEDSDVNINFTRAKKNVWKSFWQTSAWITVLMQVIIAVLLWWDDLFLKSILWATIIYSVAVLVITVRLVKKFSRIERKYKDKMKTDLFTDDDRFWIWGLFYYNPQDKRTMVETRVGAGTTTNMARPLGKILDAVGIVAIAFSILMCGWLIMEEFTPISVNVELVVENSIERKVIKACHVGTEYEIYVDTILEIECVTEVPRMSKSVGTAMDNLYKGDFYLREEQVGCTTMFNPQNTLFLRIKTPDDIYYISGVDDEETREIYEAVK